MKFVRLTRQGVTFFQAEGLGTVHGFSTRLGGISSPPYNTLNLGLNQGDAPACVRENYRRFCAALGADGNRMVCTHQVHGDVIRVATSADAGKGLDRKRDYEVDGLITDVPGLPLVVHTADCIPVLFYDPVRRAVGACHAGWRGTALGIAARAALRMREDYGCRPEHIRAAIGPGISPCCFLTRDDVPGALRDGLGSQAETCIRPAEDGRWHVDLKGANALWLRRAGLSPEHIALCPECTACRTDRFWSHRVMGERRGSMAAIIQLL